MLTCLPLISGGIIVSSWALKWELTSHKTKKCMAEEASRTVRACVRVVYVRIIIISMHLDGEASSDKGSPSIKGGDIDWVSNSV